MSEEKFELNSRVRRKDGKGPIGVVKEVRKELLNHSTLPREESDLMILVRWDNGTESFFSPAGLRLV
jgi:hypothetical protein